jgi:hypothetical protein
VPCEPGTYDLKDFSITDEIRVPKEGEFFWSEKANRVMKAAWGYMEPRQIAVRKDSPSGEPAAPRSGKSVPRRIKTNDPKALKGEPLVAKIRELIDAGESDESIRQIVGGPHFTEEFFNRLRSERGSSANQPPITNKEMNVMGKLSPADRATVDEMLKRGESDDAILKAIPSISKANLYFRRKKIESGPATRLKAGAATRRQRTRSSSKKGQAPMMNVPSGSIVSAMEGLLFEREQLMARVAKLDEIIVGLKAL